MQTNKFFNFKLFYFFSLKINIIRLYKTNLKNFEQFVLHPTYTNNLWEIKSNVTNSIFNI